VKFRGPKSAGDRGWHVGQNLVSAGMGLGTSEHELLDQLAYWVQILRLGTILGSFAGFIDSARMKLRCWTGIGYFLFGIRRKCSSKSKADPFDLIRLLTRAQSSGTKPAGYDPPRSRR
jgi:hypothetical protein